jgi:hypothetical protein
VLALVLTLLSKEEKVKKKIISCVISPGVLLRL